MKSVFFALLLGLSVSGFAQTIHGIASFTIPEGWMSAEENGTLILSPRAKQSGVCQIRISNSQKGAVNTQLTHQKYRNQSSTGNFTYSTDARSLSRHEANGITVIMSGGRATDESSGIQSSFYSLTNGESSFSIQLISDTNECTMIFNSFIQSVQVETTVLEPAENPKGQNLRYAQKRARKKAAPAPIPAAPAPMM